MKNTHNLIDAESKNSEILVFIVGNTGDDLFQNDAVVESINESPRAVVIQTIYLDDTEGQYIIITMIAVDIMITLYLLFVCFVF